MNDEHVLLAGGIELRIGYRDLGDDGGPAVRVFGSVDGEAVAAVLPEVESIMRD